MNLPQPRRSGYTLADWGCWEGRWELINGVAYDMTPAPSLEHQRISSRLNTYLFLGLEQARDKSGGACEVFAAPVDVYLGETVVQPDLIVVCDPVKKTERGIEGAPDLVVEILSPRTAGKDMTRKRWLYEASGVPEYLIVDPEEQLAVLLRLEGGCYVEAAHVEWGSVVGLLGGKLSVIVGESKPNVP
jgi:Uma2 family endonuclease